MHWVVSRKVVHDEVLFLPGGAFNRWALDIRGGLQSHGYFYAPLNERTNKTAGQPPVGTLKAGIRAEIQQLTLRRFNIELSSSAFYSSWVHQGTGRIVARGPGGRFRSAEEGMYLPRNLGYRPQWRQSVSGQRANPFLHRAWNAVAREHESMGRFTTLTI